MIRPAVATTCRGARRRHNRHLALRITLAEPTRTEDAPLSGALVDLVGNNPLEKWSTFLQDLFSNPNSSMSYLHECVAQPGDPFCRIYVQVFNLPGCSAERHALARMLTDRSGVKWVLLAGATIWIPDLRT